MTTQVDKEVEAERLRQIRALIEDVLREHDVCAHVVLAGRVGCFEGFSFLRASWSNLRLEQFPDGSALLGLRSRMADYPGRAQEQADHLAWSVSAVGGMGYMLGVASMQYLEAGERFDKATGATHTPMKREDPRDNAK